MQISRLSPKHLLDFNGRVGRGELVVIELIAAFAFVVPYGIARTIYLYMPQSVLLIVALPLFFWGLVLLAVALAACVRRLHDQGKFARNILWILMPVIGWLLVLGFMIAPGDEGANRFGPDPRVFDPNSTI